MKRGHLRIYVGFAAGVGKTFAMLGEGHRRRDRGTDVVIGFVESHGRPMTEDAIGDLEIVPRRTIDYRGAAFEEMDVDAIIARAPDGGPGGRARAHERPRLRAREALAGCGSDPRSRDRRHLHGQHPAPGIVERRRGAHHRRPSTRDDPRRDRAGRRSARARRHDAVRPAPAHGPRQHLSTGEGRRRPRQLLPGRQPRSTSGTRPAVDGRPRGRVAPGLHEGSRHRGAMGDARADPGRGLRSARGRAVDPPRGADGGATRRRPRRRQRHPGGRPGRDRGRSTAPANSCERSAGPSAR